MSKTRIRLTVAAALASMALAACSSSDKSSSDKDPDALIPVKIGATGAVSNVDLQLAVEKGFFADEGLDVEIVWAQSGAAVVPAVMNGGQQFGEAAVISLLLADAKNLPITPIGSASQGASDPKADTVGVIVPADSPIKTPKDLEGKTIATNALQSLGQVTTRGVLDDLGVDSSKVKFTEMPFPSMALAMKQGEVDGAWQTEPFLTPALESGSRLILSSNTGLSPNLQMGLMFTSDKFLAENKDTVERMQRALAKALEYAGENPDEIRALAVKQFKLDPAVAESMNLPSWHPEINRDSIKIVDELLVRYGLLKKPTDLKAFLANADG